MCGRMILTADDTEMIEYFGLASPPERSPRYNIAPTQPVLAIRSGADGHPAWAWFRWGLVPSWAKDPSDAARRINARSETVASVPSFRAAFRHRRCLIPVTGFYEWSGSTKHRQAWLFRLAGGGPFALAGLWERWENAAGVLETCTVLTTAASALVGRVHDRMPVILDPADHGRWLGKGGEDLLVPFPAERMDCIAVGPAVNRSTYDGPECIVPAGGSFL
jgi:putative SOS response-associated peptidase YedK